MRIKDGFIKQDVAGTYVAIATGEAASEFRGMIKLNATASFLWDFMAEDTTIEALVETLCSNYDVDAETAKKDIEAMVKQLRDAGVLV